MSRDLLNNIDKISKLKEFPDLANPQFRSDTRNSVDLKKRIRIRIFKNRSRMHMFFLNTVSFHDMIESHVGQVVPYLWNTIVIRIQFYDGFKNPNNDRTIT